MKTLFTLLSVIALGLVGSAQCTDLFFSEYIEGSGNNKALEIYNPTSATIDLSDYNIHRNSNGSATSSGSTTLSGMLMPGDVFVVTNSSAAVANIIAQSDLTSGVITFNGDDAVWLEKISTGDTLDIIGELGVDPGTNWPVDTGSTLNHTLVRKINIQGGQTDWAIGATEWDLYVQDMADSLGMHTMTPCAVGPCTATSSSIMATACETYTAPSGITYTSTGTYNDTILNAAGCDSVIIITLQINNASFSSDVIVACNSYTWINDSTYTSSNNTATDTLTNAMGCDSIITLNLTINYSPSLTVFTESCGPNTYIDGGGQAIYYTSDTTIVDTLTGSNGCDSIVTVVITVNDTYSVDDIITTCEDSYMWIDSNVYTANNNTATMTYLTVDGCDSVVTLDLTFITVNTGVNIIPESSVLTASQSNAAYQWLECNNGYAAIPGETAQSFSPSVLGAYAVEITINGCTDTSSCYNVNPSGLEDYNLFSEVNIFPNPSNGPVTVNLDGLNSVDIELVDIAGKKIISARNISDSSYIIDGSFPAGIYFITLKSEGESRTYKLVIK